MSGVGLNDTCSSTVAEAAEDKTYLMRDVRVFGVKLREKVLEQVDFAARTVTTEQVDSAFIFLYRTQQPASSLTRVELVSPSAVTHGVIIIIIIVIIIHEFHRDASLEQNFRAAMYYTTAVMSMLLWPIVCVAV